MRMWIENRLHNELEKAKDEWPPIQGSHEGASLIQEELEEFRMEIRNDQTFENHMAIPELIQIAAMAIRTLEDVYT